MSSDVGIMVYNFSSAFNTVQHRSTREQAGADHPPLKMDGL